MNKEKYREIVEQKFGESVQYSIGQNLGILISGAGELDGEYKKPIDALVLGSSEFEKQYEMIKEDLRFPNRPLLEEFGRDEDPKDNLEHLLSQDISKYLKKDLKNNLILAVGTHTSKLAKYFGTKDHKELDSSMKEIEDKEVSENMRTVLNARLATHYAKGIQGMTDTYMIKIYKQEPELFGKIINYAFKVCLQNGHEHGRYLMDFLADNPEAKKLVDPIHLDYTLPYIFERKAVPWCDGWDAKRQNEKDLEMLQLMQKLDINPEKVQEIINQNSVNPRKYLDGFFERKGCKNE